MTRYTDAQVAQALAALELNGGNVKRTARELGINHETVRAWKLRMGVPLGVTREQHQATVQAHQHDWASMYGEAQIIALDRARAIAPTMPATPDGLRALMVMAGVSADKHLNYRDGRTGANINVDARNQTIYTSDALIASLLRAKSGLIEEGEDDEAG